MDVWNSDILLNVISFLNVKDSGRLASTAKRYYYLIHQYRRLRGPELVAATSHVPTVRQQRTPDEIVQDALQRLQAPPNLVLAFNTLSSTLAESLPQMVPDNSVIVGAVSGVIQSSLPQQLEYKSNASVMLGSLTNATIRPFLFEETASMEEYQAFRHQLSQDDTEWKVFIVYAAGEHSSKVENFVDKLQSQFPRSTIVGGICSMGYVSLPVQRLTKEELSGKTSHELLYLNRCLGGPQFGPVVGKRELEDHVYQVMQSKQYCLRILDDDGGIYGVALGGDVPVRSMVSRGVRSLTLNGDPQPSTPFVVDQAEYHRPDGDNYTLIPILLGNNRPSYHLINRIRNQETGKVYSPRELLSSFGQPDLIGVRRPNQDGFELHMQHPLSLSLNAFMFMQSGADDSTDSLEGANIDLFDLDGAACIRDIKSSMQLLRDQMEGEQILGAVMFSCGARGPVAGPLISEDMADAKYFAEAFPDVPCLGFYAGGEIGPLALAGRRSAFQTGNAQLQGFTAVFALFVVPVVDFSAMELNDCRENVEAFVESRLGLHVG